mgnify:CR=1 FL=1
MTPHDVHSSHHETECHGVSTDLADYFLTRRQLIGRIGMGMGALALPHLLDPRDLVAAPAKAGGAPKGPLSPKAPHFAGKAKAVIHIFAQGAPSHIDTWDPKPMLTRMDGKTIQGKEVALGSPFTFSKYGQSGLEVSSVFAKTAAHADDLAPQAGIPALPEILHFGEFGHGSDFQKTGSG